MQHLPISPKERFAYHRIVGVVEKTVVSPSCHGDAVQHRYRRSHVNAALTSHSRSALAYRHAYATSATAAPVRLLIYGLNYAPEPTGVGRYTADMAAWLRAQGYDVRVVTAYPYYPAWRVSDGYRAWWYGRETLDGVVVHRCPLWVPRRAGTLKRVLHLASFALGSLPMLLWQSRRWRPDVVWTSEPTVLGAPGALLAARLAGARSWLHVQDIELSATARLGLIENRWLRRAILAFYRGVLRSFGGISTISRTMAGELAELGAPATVQFPNWVDVAAIRPGADAAALRAELGVPPDALIALYSGNLGAKQGVDTLVGAARRLAHRDDLHFLICGEGVAKAELAAAAADLPNVSLRPLQPLERFNELLNLADVHLLPQRRGNTLFAMPSKLGGMLASGRAIVAQADAGSEFAELIADCALVVACEDVDATAAAVARLADDPALRARLGGNGRRLAVETLSRDAVLQRFVDALRHVLGHDAVAAGRTKRSWLDRSSPARSEGRV